LVEIRELVRNSGASNGVDLTLRELTGRNDSLIATLQARTLLRRQQYCPFATVLGNRHRLREGNVLIDTDIAVKLRGGDGDSVIERAVCLSVGSDRWSARGLAAIFIQLCVFRRT